MIIGSSFPHIWIASIQFVGQNSVMTWSKAPLLEWIIPKQIMKFQMVRDMKKRNCRNRWSLSVCLIWQFHSSSYINRNGPYLFSWDHRLFLWEILGATKHRLPWFPWHCLIWLTDSTCKENKQWRRIFWNSKSPCLQREGWI